LLNAVNSGETALTWTALTESFEVIDLAGSSIAITWNPELNETPLSFQPYVNFQLPEEPVIITRPPTAPRDLITGEVGGFIGDEIQAQQYFTDVFHRVTFSSVPKHLLRTKMRWGFWLGVGAVVIAAVLFYSCKARQRRAGKPNSLSNYPS
jgi:hypothetical protein